MATQFKFTFLYSSAPLTEEAVLCYICLSGGRNTPSTRLLRKELPPHKVTKVGILVSLIH